MKCVNCGSTMHSARGTHRYTESGLSDVTLVNVEIRSCPECGEREVVIPKIEQLHKMISREVSRRPRPLEPDEIKFLRKWLGYSMVDFALTMGVRPETVSRWESKGAGYQMPSTAERLLRMLVANQEPIEKYPVDLFKTQPRVKPQPIKLKAPDWRKAVS